ncbi:MAG TPA: cytochrome C oxidase subunit IV family protein [Chitinophagaceae bacterium]
MAQTATADSNAGKREIKRVTIILSVLTLVELALGFSMIGMEESFLRHFIKGAIVILMLAKAFYITAYFMHLGHELKNMIMTIVVPLGLFIWFIIAFLADGSSYRNLRNNYDKSYHERTTQPANQGATPGKHDVKDVKPKTGAPEGGSSVGH